MTDYLCIQIPSQWCKGKGSSLT